MKKLVVVLVSIIIVVFVFVGCEKQEAVELSSRTLYLDAQNGNDHTADGSEDKPFKTFNHAMDSLESGDILMVYNGDYGDIIVGRTPGENWGSNSEISVPYSKFHNWVTIKAVAGHRPHFKSLSIGTLNIPNSGSPAKQAPFSQKGNSDLYMSFDGFIVDDGITIKGSRHVKIENCTISSEGDLNGSAANLDGKAGITILNGRYITIKNNLITKTAIGINAASYDLEIINNEICFNSHDGIRILGGENWLIDGNRIHDLDDGTSDGEVSWDRHSDGIHLFQLIDVTRNLTVRNNLFYHIESMDVMAQGGDENNHNANWIFENNVFCPSGGILIHLGTGVYQSWIFRHNTVVYAPNDKWVSIFGRQMHSNQYHIALWANDNVNPGCKFYNNIFAGSTTKVPSAYKFVAGNIFTTENNLPYEPISGNIADYIKSGKIPGMLIDGSKAIDKGDINNVSELTTDFNGKKRDNKPDIGAFEK